LEKTSHFQDGGHKRNTSVKRLVNIPIPFESLCEVSDDELKQEINFI